MNPNVFPHKFSAVLKYQLCKNLRFKNQIIMEILLKNPLQLLWEFVFEKRLMEPFNEDTIH